MIWAVMFYGILSWLQPLLVEGDPGNWITNPAYLPWWVAAATHLVFGWTIALLYPLGRVPSLPSAHRTGRMNAARATPPGLPCRRTERS